MKPHATRPSDACSHIMSCQNRWVVCGLSRARTDDPFLVREVLYQLSYESSPLNAARFWGAQP